ncbi:MAG: outer membrane beta-barrel protein, partial [Gemmataceae bacterium]
GAFITFNDQWSGVFMLVNGNDIYLGNSAEEMRTVGNLSWKANAKDTVTVAWGLGRGKFNTGAPFPTVTVALPTEPLGRNNFNNVDLVWQHVFNAKWTYAVEGIYGWQYGAPDPFNPTMFGTATWGSVAQYLFYQMTPNVQGILRVEEFEDAVAERTGFAGLYTAITTGLRINLRKGVIFRPELRYDYNGNSLPFEGKHDIFVADADLIIRW